MKKIVIIGGGTGTSTLLKGLKKYPAHLSVIVSTADDGGSTGKLRETLGVLPPGDMRQCLVALSGRPKLAENFNFRFPSGELQGHTVGNLILASLEKRYGIKKALAIVVKVLKVKGQVLPVTLRPTVLFAVLENGKIIEGEHNIDEPNPDFRLKIKDLKLKPNGPVNSGVVAAIKKADAIIFGPGDLYTSTLPNLLVKGVKEAINQSKAKKILVANIMTKFGQTDGFGAQDFVKVLEKYLHAKINVVLVNNKKPPGNLVKKYKREKAKFIEVDMRALAKTKVEAIAQDLISEKEIERNPADKLKRSILRHDSKKLAKLIWELV